MFQIEFNKDKLFALVSNESMYASKNAIGMRGEDAHLSLILTNDERDYFNRAIDDAANELVNTISMLFDGMDEGVLPFETGESSFTIRGIMQNDKPQSIVLDDMQKYLVKHVLKQWFADRLNPTLIAKYNDDFEKAERTLLVRIQRKEQRVKSLTY